MFGVFSTIGDDLATYAREIEEKLVGLRVIGGRIFAVPVVELWVQVNVLQRKHLTVIEEFILKAAASLSPPPTQQEIAENLGLDDIFVRVECERLVSLDAINQASSTVTLTPLGEKFLKERLVPRPVEQRTLRVLWDSFTGRFKVSMAGENEYPVLRGGEAVIPGVPDDEEVLSKEARAAFSHHTLEEELEGLYPSQDGYIIDKILSLSVNQILKKPVGVLAVWDMAEERMFFRTVDLVSDNYLLDYDDLLADGSSQPTDDKQLTEELLQEIGILAQSEESEAEDEMADYVANVEALVKQKLELERQGTDTGQSDVDLMPNMPGLKRIDYLTDSQIRPRFVEVLDRAQESVIIVSPWVTDEVVNDEFMGMLRKLASRHVLILLGWGIALSPQQEERRLSPSVRQRLQSIKTPDHVRAVSLIWLGNQHKKDLIVDKRIHFCGSFNWLSYLGSYRVRGESVLYVEGDGLQQPVEHMRKLFSRAAESEWKSFVQTPTRQISMHRCINVWSVLELEQEGVNRIEMLAREYPERIPKAAEALRFLLLSLWRGGQSPARDRLQKLLPRVEEFRATWDLQHSGFEECELLGEAINTVRNGLQ